MVYLYAMYTGSYNMFTFNLVCYYNCGKSITGTIAKQLLKRGCVRIVSVVKKGTSISAAVESLQSLTECHRFCAVTRTSICVALTIERTKRVTLIFSHSVVNLILTRCRHSTLVRRHRELMAF